MTRIFARILAPLALVSTFAFSACDDGDSDTTPAADTSTSAATEAPADDVAAPSDDAAAPGGDAHTPAPPTNRCTTAQ